jgi:cell wall-associated NlpC family hydrolase
VLGVRSEEWVGARRRTPATLVAAALLLSGLAIGAGPASGDELDDARAQAQHIAARVDELNQQIEILAESYNAAQDQLAGVQARIAAAQAEVAAAQAEVDARQADVRDYAVTAYVRGGDTGTLQTVLNSGTGAEAGQRRSYLTAATGDQQSVIDGLRATQEELQAQLAEHYQAQAEAQQLTDSIAGQRQQVEAAQAEQRQLLDSANAEVSRLLAEEQARQAAEAARQAAARAAAAQQQAAAAPRTTSRTTSGTSGSGGSGGSADPAPAPNNRAGVAVQTGLDQRGDPYEWGAAGPDSFDCSGLTMYAWNAAGVSLPHNSASQYSATTHIPMSEIQPGDLVFYGSPIHHVALYIGNGQIVHAPHSGDVVRVDSVYYWDDLVGVGRVR